MNSLKHCQAPEMPLFSSIEVSRQLSTSNGLLPKSTQLRSFLFLSVSTSQFLWHGQTFSTTMFIPLTNVVGIRFGQQIKSFVHCCTSLVSISCLTNWDRFTMQDLIILGKSGTTWTLCPLLLLSASFQSSSGSNTVSLIFIHLLDEKPEDNHIEIYPLVAFHSLASFLMWIKLLYFMRIFNQTGKKNGR